MKNQTRLVLATVTILTFFATCVMFSQVDEASAKGWDDVEQITIKYSTSVSKNHPTFLGIDPYIEKLEEVSGGKIATKVYPGQVLFSGKEVLSGLKDGGCQSGHLTLEYHPSELPLMSVVNSLGWVGATTADPVASSGAISEILTLHSELFEEDANRNNIFVLGAYATGPFGLISTDPVKTLQDWEGLKVRGSGLHSEYIKQLGGTPVGIRYSEAFEGLQRGTIDAVTGSFDFMRAYGYWDVCKYFTELRLGSFIGGAEFALSKDWFDSLPKIAKRAIVENYPILLAGATMRGYVLKEQETKKEAVEERGVKILSPAPDLEKELDKIIAQTTDEISQKSAKKERVDIERAEKIVSTYFELYKKWEKLSQDVIKDDPKKFEKALREEIYKPFLKKLDL